MVSDFFKALTDSGTGFVNFIVGAIQSIWEIFYSSGGGEGDPAGFTSIGLFMIVTLAIGIVYGLIRWITKLIHLRG